MSHLRLDIPLWNRSTEGRTDGDLFPVNGAVLNLDGSDDRKFKDWNMSYLRIIWHCIEMGTNIFSHSVRLLVWDPRGEEQTDYG